ncbi:MAG TPA: peptidoglycan DD-metalloendopeptidase family protein [Spirochaetota bacterium]|nr:peptidoglycan DD-metalloendopeptidase family protein [Spirochaetota bacterium]
MKNSTRKTFRFGRFNLTVLTNEVMVFYAGRDKIYFKRFYLSAPRFSKKIAFALLIAVFISLAVLYSGLKAPGPDREIAQVVDPLADDDREKNRILLSENTDYSTPDESRALVISEHVVAPGENLSAIAKQYGISIDTICGSNNLTSYDFIREGVHLKIPNKDGIIYRMKDGNNIAGIAERYRVSLEKIIAENRIENPDFVPVDAVLFIPDAKPQNIVNGFMWPCSIRVITCGYGWRQNPFNAGYREFHQGLDIRARYEWVRSSKYGKVTYTGWLGGYGKTIVIAHPGGWKTLYGHLSKIIVRPGQYVKQGQSIGKSGNTGRSTGPHLHFEITKYGSHTNPYSHLKKSRI